jgi:hypothetical protein
MKVTNINTLRQEKARLKYEVLESEKIFYDHYLSIEKQVSPITRFLFRNGNSGAATSNDNSKDWLNKGVHSVIPILVDQLTLGTRGLIINRVLTVVLQLFAGKVTTEKVINLGQSILKSGFDKINFNKKKTES